MNMMDDEECIAAHVAALEDSIRYFSNAGKEERERWVVAALLENFNISLRPEEVISCKDDPPDVLAFEGRFEIKEILDVGRLRHKEYKEELKRIKRVVDKRDLLVSFTPVDLSMYAVLQRCYVELEKLESKYPSELRSSLDLLFYMNFQNVLSLREDPSPCLESLKSCGWRSVTFVKGEIACCLYADIHAPAWLRTKVGKIQRKIWA